MSEKRRRDRVLTARVDEDERAVVQNAADAAGMSVSAFVRELAVGFAEEVEQQQEGSDMANEQPIPSRVRDKISAAVGTAGEVRELGHDDLADALQTVQRELRQAKSDASASGDGDGDGPAGNRRAGPKFASHDPDAIRERIQSER